MPGLRLTHFSGLRPRAPESLLREGEATIAQNCDFAYGELRNCKGGFAYQILNNSPSSLYTSEGLAFYSWTADVNAVRSPLANDTFNRLYYTGDNGFKVTDRTGTRVNGGPPSSSYLVGVPTPSTAPNLTALMPPPVTASTANIVWTFHWEDNGIKYQEQPITPLPLVDDKYQFTPPALSLAPPPPPEGSEGGGVAIEYTPPGAFPVVRMKATWKADDAEIFDLYTTNSSFESSGGIFTLELSRDDGAAGTYTLKLSASIKEEDKETRAYVYTYVNTYGEEGPPSPPGLVTTSPVVGATIDMVKDAVSGFAPIKEIRIYRTPTGSSIANFFFVASVSVLTSPPGMFTFEDRVKPEMLNEPLASAEYYPPNQALIGLLRLPNGILCAWKGNELHFSEAFKPWAWPPKYVLTFPSDIVTGSVHGAGAVIVTRTYPYLVAGVSADSMTMSKINVDQAGVSKWAIAVVDGVVIYGSNDGLVTVSGASATLAPSQQFFTREVWRQRFAYGLSSMRFTVWDGRLVVFSANGAFTPFMIRFDEAGGTMTELPSFFGQCAFVNPLSDQFYYAWGQTLYQFNGGADISATWQSREIVLPHPKNFGAAQALVTGDWTIQFWAYCKNANGTSSYQLRHSQALSDGQSNFRLPGGYESDRYRIKISGIGRFRELRIGRSFRELATL